MSSESVDARAEAIFRAEARPERLWPLAVGAAVLYVLATSWGFSRAFGDTGRVAQVQAAPSVLVLLAIVGTVAAARFAARAETRAGGSPWRWPRLARRSLAVLAVALPLFSFGVAPIVAITTVDAGRTDVPPPVSWLVNVSVDIR